MPVKSRRGYKKSNRFVRYGGKFAKTMATSAGQVAKVLPSFVKGAKYVPFVGQAMQQQYKAYSDYVKARQPLKPRTKVLQGGQLTHEKTQKVMLSKPMTSTQKALRLVKANKEKTVYRLNGIASASTGAGYFFLQNVDDASVSPVNRILPLHAYDITCVNTIRSTTGTVTSAVPATSAQANIASGDIDFVSMSFQNLSGASTSNLQIEYQPYNNVSALPASRDLLKWTEIKFNLYGTKNEAVKYDIMLVQFKDRDLLPRASTGAPSTDQTVAVSDKRTNFYQSLLKPLTHNAISTTPSIHIKKMRVLKRQTVVIQDNTSISNDQDPNNRVVKWFITHNKVCNYAQSATNLTTVADAFDDADFAFQQGGQNSCYVNALSRVFLIVMATNYGKETFGNVTTANTPSYDISIRMCHENFA